MKLSDLRAIKATNWFSDMVFNKTDATSIGNVSYKNFTDIMALLAVQGKIRKGSNENVGLSGVFFSSGGDNTIATSKDLVPREDPEITTIITGLEIIHNTLLTTTIKAGVAVSFKGYYDISGDSSISFVADEHAAFTVLVPIDQSLSFSAGGSLDRVDTVEIRPTVVDYHGVVRNFYDPITGAPSSSLVNSRKAYGFEFSVRMGTESATPVAQATTAGWIKLAEVYVAAAASSITQGDIKDVRDSDTWTTDIEGTISRYSSVAQTLLGLTTESSIKTNLSISDKSPLENLILRRWVKRNSPQWGLGFSAFAEGQVAGPTYFFSALGSFGPQNLSRYAKSSDGITWTIGSLTMNGNWTDMVYAGGSINLLVAVGANLDDTTKEVLTSPDGDNWTLRTTSSGRRWFSIDYSPSLGLLCAVGDIGASSLKVMTSPDAINWTDRTAAADIGWRDIAWGVTPAVFCAIAGTAGTQSIMTSPDGINWTLRTHPSTTLGGISWSTSVGLFVAVGDGIIMTSSNGTTWTTRTLPSGYTSQFWSSVTFAAGSVNLFVAIAYQNITDPTKKIVTSPDGVTWTGRTIPLSGSGFIDNITYTKVSWANNLAILFAPGSQIDTHWGGIYSTDAINWTGIDIIEDPKIRDIVWCPELKLFCAIGSGDYKEKQVYTSVDGVSWFQHITASNNAWYAIAWSPYLGLFVAVSNTGTGDRIMTSTNGMNWTTRTSAADSSWESVVWSPEQRLFCAVGIGASGQQVMTSPDGVTWTLRSITDRDWKAVTWSPELGLFVAVAVSGTGDRVATSPDGITWTLRSSAADYSWQSIAWSPELGLFAAVSSGGETDGLMTSDDGITWTLRTLPESLTLRKIIWVSELSHFVAVASTGNNRIVISEDGITWTSASDPNPSAWHGVAWSPLLGILVGGAYDGAASERLMSTL